jgi:predicted XRE-type DNA-binding protein
MKIDTKKIGSFLKSIDGADYIYMQRCMEMRNAINNLIKRHDLSKKDVCQRFKLKTSKYNDFVKGNYNYSVKDMAILNAAFMELEAEKLKDEVPVKVS